MAMRALLRVVRDPDCQMQVHRARAAMVRTAAPSSLTAAHGLLHCRRGPAVPVGMSRPKCQLYFEHAFVYSRPRLEVGHDDLLKDRSVLHRRGGPCVSSVTAEPTSSTTSACTNRSSAAATRW